MDHYYISCKITRDCADLQGSLRGPMKSQEEKDMCVVHCKWDAADECADIAPPSFNTYQFPND